MVKERNYFHPFFSDLYILDIRDRVPLVKKMFHIVKTIQNPRVHS